MFRALLLCCFLLSPSVADAKTKKPPKPQHPDSSGCLSQFPNTPGRICVENVWRDINGEFFTATIFNDTDLSVGTCYVKFIVKQNGTIVDAAEGSTPVALAPHERQKITSTHSVPGFDPMNQVELSCPIVGINNQRITLDWPVFQNLIDGWAYARKLGYK